MRKSASTAVSLVLLFPLTIFAQQKLPPDLQPGFEECTTGVASGRATADGRPLLWKNRDTGQLNNELAYFTDGRYKYLAIINAGATRSAWMGVNEKGFCIENSVISDLPGGANDGLGNGGFMKRALQQCATVDDFEKLLEQTNTAGRRTKANFGVIDAKGGAAIFETGHTAYTKFDANDPKVAPDGYIVRSNFTMTGNAEAGGDRHLTDVRYLRGDAICKKAVAKDQFDHRYVLRNFSRDLADAEGSPYKISINGGGAEIAKVAANGIINTRATISRRSTASAVVFHGVRPDENPDLTTMWTVLGEPIFSVAIPAWVKSAGVAPLLDGPELSPLCSAVLEVKNANYAQRRELRTGGLKKIWAVTYPAEDRILIQTQEMLGQWRTGDPTPSEMLDFHKTMAAQATEAVVEVLKRMTSTSPEGTASPKKGVGGR